MTAPPASPRAVALTALQGQVVGLDTAPLIYYIATYRLLGGGNKNIMTPDAIQLATARLTGASYFFTGEDRLPAIETLSIVTPRTLLVQLNPSAGNDG